MNLYTYVSMPPYGFITEESKVANTTETSFLFHAAYHPTPGQCKLSKLSENWTIPLLQLPHAASCSRATVGIPPVSFLFGLDLTLNRRVHRQLEDFVNTLHLLA